MSLRRKINTCPRHVRRHVIINICTTRRASHQVFPRERTREREREREGELSVLNFEKTYCTVGLWACTECTKALGIAARLLCEGPNGRMGNDVDETLCPMRTFIIGSIIFTRGIFDGKKFHSIP